MFDETDRAIQAIAALFLLKGWTRKDDPHPPGATEIAETLNHLYANITEHGGTSMSGRLWVHADSEGGYEFGVVFGMGDQLVGHEALDE